MKLHLPVSLFRLLLGCFFAIVPATVAQAYVTHETFLIESDLPYPLILSDCETVIISECGGCGINNLGELNVKKNDHIYILDNEDTGIYNKNSLDIFDNGDIFISGNGGCGISNKGRLEISGNGNMVIDNHASYGIDNTATLSLSGNGDITITRSALSDSSITSGSSIYNKGELSMAGNKNISLTDDSSDARVSSTYGGSLYNAGRMTLDNNESFSISGYTGSIYGGAFYNAGATEMNANGVISISGNAVSRIDGRAHGGGIFNSGTLSLSGNDVISIANNTATASMYNYYYTAYAYGGGLCNYTENNSIHAVLSLMDNREIAISGNAVSGSEDGCGGGLCNYAYSNNTASVTTASVVLSGNEHITVSDNSSSEYGGGLCNFADGRYGSSCAEMELSFNGEISISGNITFRQYGEHSYGGGICNDAVSANNTATLSMLGNTFISISNNTTSSMRGYGGGIYNSGNAMLAIVGNGEVSFSDNQSKSTTSSYSGGGAIYNEGTALIQGNGVINVSGNAASSTGGDIYGGGICNVGSATISENGKIIISNNTCTSPVNVSGYPWAFGGGLAHCQGLLDMFSNANISISGNTASGSQAYGGGIAIGSRNGAYQGATLSLNNNSHIDISGNCASSPRSSSDSACGGGIYLYGSTLSMADNGDIDIVDNRASGLRTMGGGICNDTKTSYVSIVHNHDIHLTGNIISGETTNVNTHIYAYGGGICNYAYSSASHMSMVLDNNRDIEISGNIAEATSPNSYVEVCGGGICNYAYHDYCNAELSINANRDIAISGNQASGYYCYGGGIFNRAYYSSARAILELSDNQDIIISGNAASGSYSYGGGIYNGGSLSIRGNDDVSIINNTVSGTKAYGGGIYNNGEITLANNQSVTFRANLQHSSTNAVLNGIYAETSDSSKVVTLAAPETGRMDFYDPILVKMSSTTEDTLLHLNGVQDEESGEYSATGGVIRLTGESTEADLLAAYERAGLDIPVTQAAITASRTSSTNGHTALHGGELQIVQQAILETNGLTAEGTGHSTLRLENGTLRSTAAVTVESGSTLALAGVNTLTATTLDVQNGAILEFTLGSANATDAALALNATLNTGALDLRLIGADELSTGIYKLITLADASQYSTDSWTSDLVSVTGGSWERLTWQEGTLYYSTESIEVTDNETETITTGTVPLPIVIREGVALFQQEGADSLIMSYDSTTTDAGRLANIESDTSFARINVGAPEGSVNVLTVAEGQTASTVALNGAGDLAKTGSGTLEITGAGDHSGTLTIQQGRVSLIGEGQLSSSTIILGNDASSFSLRRTAARSTDAPLITTESGITLAQNDSSRAASLSGHEPLSAQGTAIIGQADQRAVADNVCISLDNAQATFTLGNLDLNNTVVDATAAAGLILHDVRLDATSQVSNRADVLAQMTGQNSLQLGDLVSITGNGQLSTEQLYGVELTSTGSLTLGMDSDLLAAAGLTEGSVAELWLAGLQAADTATLSFEDVLQADGLKLAITIQAIEHATDGTRLQIAVAAVPEPATATLTLLALTALAARRRRGLRPAC